MNKRLLTLFSLIEPCGTFADIGCDHGIISKEILDKGVAEKVYAADISAPSLNKAATLIGRAYEGRFFTFLSDGFSRLPQDIDCALIAGLGGEETLSILDGAPSLPPTLVLQPMKNADKVRRKLVLLGYGIDRDFTFFASDKYYDVIRAKRGLIVDGYTEDEYRFGRDNLRERSNDFLRFLQMRLNVLNEALKNAGDPVQVEKLKRERLKTEELL